MEEIRSDLEKVAYALKDKMEKTQYPFYEWYELGEIDGEDFGKMALGHGCWLWEIEEGLFFMENKMIHKLIEDRKPGVLLTSLGFSPGTPTIRIPMPLTELNAVLEKLRRLVAALTTT